MAARRRSDDLRSTLGWQPDRVAPSEALARDDSRSSPQGSSRARSFFGWLFATAKGRGNGAIELDGGAVDPEKCLALLRQWADLDCDPREKDLESHRHELIRFVERDGLPLNRLDGVDLCSLGGVPLEGGRYLLIGRIGGGAFGAVYHALDTLTQRRVAVKVIRPGHDQPIEKEQRLAEARSLAALEHPNIVQIYDVDMTTSGHTLITMPRVVGERLSDLFLDPVSRNPGLIGRLFSQIASGLAHVHSRGVVHRDLKPANVLVTAPTKAESELRITIVDFGLAVRDEDQHLCRGQIAGTPAYMSPEQVRGESQWVDGRSDIWSLGVMLYECLTGKQPFQGGDWEGIRSQILNREPKPPRMHDPSIPAFLEDLCLKCMEKDVRKRYSNCGEIVRCLDQGTAIVLESVPNSLRETVFLDRPRLRSYAAQLGVPESLPDLLLADKLIDEMRSNGHLRESSPMRLLRQRMTRFWAPPRAKGGRGLGIWLTHAEGCWTHPAHCDPPRQSPSRVILLENFVTQPEPQDVEDDDEERADDGSPETNVILCSPLHLLCDNLMNWEFDHSVWHKIVPAELREGTVLDKSRLNVIEGSLTGDHLPLLLELNGCRKTLPRNVCALYRIRAQPRLISTAEMGILYVDGKDGGHRMGEDTHDTGVDVTVGYPLFIQDVGVDQAK